MLTLATESSQIASVSNLPDWRSFRLPYMKCALAEVRSRLEAGREAIVRRGG